MRAFLAAVSAVLLTSGLAFAETIKVVPGEGTPLQDALDQAQDGDVIVVKKGTYNETLSMVGRSDITIIGKGKPVIDATGLGGALYFEAVDGLTVSGLVIRNSSSDGIHTYECSNVVISKCTIEDCLDSGTEDYESDGIVIEKNRIARVAWGVKVSYNDSTGSTGIRVSKNRMTEVTGVGIQFAGNGAVVEKNRIEIDVGGNQGTGIIVDDSAPWTGAGIRSNRIAAAGDGMQDGITLSGGNHELLKNTVLNPRGYGIEVDGDGGNEVEKNTVKGAGISGIWVDSTGNSFSKNKVSGSVDFDLESAVEEAVNTFVKNKFGTTFFPAPK